jgi:hypothetical protein
MFKESFRSVEDLTTAETSEKVEENEIKMANNNETSV